MQFLNPPEGMKNLGYDFNKVYLGHREGREFNIVDSVAVKENGQLFPNGRQSVDGTKTSLGINVCAGKIVENT